MSISRRRAAGAKRDKVCANVWFHPCGFPRHRGRRSGRPCEIRARQRRRQVANGPPRIAGTTAVWSRFGQRRRQAANVAAASHARGPWFDPRCAHSHRRSHCKQRDRAMQVAQIGPFVQCRAVPGAVLRTTGRPRHRVVKTGSPLRNSPNAVVSSNQYSACRCHLTVPYVRSRARRLSSLCSWTSARARRSALTDAGSAFAPRAFTSTRLPLGSRR